MEYFDVLAENTKGDNIRSNEDGLSLYIELDENKLLFDTGETDVFIKNAEKLGINLDEVPFVVISYGHHDHSNGLKYLNENKTVILHPDCFIDRYSQNDSKDYRGIDQKAKEIEDKFSLIQTKEPYEICKDVWFLGEIPRENEFENTLAKTVLEGNKPDYVYDIC